MHESTGKGLLTVGWLCIHEQMVETTLPACDKIDDHREAFASTLVVVEVFVVVLVGDFAVVPEVTAVVVVGARRLAAASCRFGVSAALTVTVTVAAG